MKYIIDFLKKEKNFFIGSGLILFSSYITIFIYGIFNTYKINKFDSMLIIFFFCTSYELFKNGLDTLFKDNKK